MEEEAQLFKQGAEEAENEIKNITLKLLNANHQVIPQNEEYEKLLSTLGKKLGLNYVLFSSDIKYENFDQFYNYFKQRLDNNIKSINQLRNVNISYKTDYDKKIFKKLVQEFHHKRIPILIESNNPSGTFYVNKLFPELIDEYTNLFTNKLNTKSEKVNFSVYEDIVKNNKDFNTLGAKLETLKERFLKEMQQTKSEIEIQTLTKKHKEQLESLTEQLKNAKEEALQKAGDNEQIKNEIQKGFDDMQNKIEQLKNSQKLTGVAKVLEESRKFLLALAPYLTTGGIGAIVTGTLILNKEDEKKYKTSNKKLQDKLLSGNLNDKIVVQIRNDFLKQNQTKLDNLTNDSVRNNKDDKQLLSKSLALGYKPKNITVKL